MAVRRGGATPSKVFRGTVPVKKAMRGTVEVWSATITIIATTPTFLTASPWVTLPSQEGVTYSLAGTPGYGATVTVTATAQAGYELAGQTTWMHTYGPPPRYVASDSGGNFGVLSSNSWTTITTHNVASSGTASGTWTTEWRMYAQNMNQRLRVRRNNSTIAENSRPGGSYTSPAPMSVTILTTSLTAGDTLTFQALSDATNIGYREINSWSWSLS